jgi:hypothetical protein
MDNHRCRSQKSLTTVRKWLLEAGDGPRIPSSRFDHNIQSKSCFNKIIKRKRFNKQKYYSKTISIIDWFYESIKKIFTVYDENQLKCDNHPIDDTTVSLMTCSTCQFESTDPYINTNLHSTQSPSKSSKTSSVLYSKIHPKAMVTTATSNSNLHSSKSTQTQANHNEQQSTVYPLYCFSIKDGQVLPLILSSPSLLDPSFNSPILPLTSNNDSYSSHPPTISSMISSNSNILSLQPTQNRMTNDILSKIRHPSLHDTRIYHFDKRNCLIECYHSSNNENKQISNFHCSSNTPDIVFAESTCQLIKQAWISSTSDQ